MAGQTGRKVPVVKNELFTNGQRFSFIQAFRLLCFYIQRESSTSWKDSGSVLDKNDIFKKIHTRPELSLDFPESDINSIEKISTESTASRKGTARYLITVTFLGLYGSSSPLPTFYTEDLLHERAEDKSIDRDFIDIINSPIYVNFFKVWSKYRLFFKIAEQFDPEVLHRLYCLLGLESEKLQKQVENSYGLIRYIGLITQFPRSSQGLQSLLADALKEQRIRVIQCVKRLAEIPPDQRFFLGFSGNMLGDNSYLGSKIIDKLGKFKIQIRTLNSESFHRFIPDRPAFGKLYNLVRFYLNQPLIWDLELLLNSKIIKSVRLGSSLWSQLGWNSWIFSERLSPVTISVTLGGNDNNRN